MSRLEWGGETQVESLFFVDTLIASREMTGGKYETFSGDDERCKLELASAMHKSRVGAGMSAIQLCGEPSSVQLDVKVALICELDCLRGPATHICAAFLWMAIRKAILIGKFFVLVLQVLEA